MRLIGTFDNEKQVYKLYSLFKEKGIDSIYESVRENDHMIYQIWVFDEDQFQQAAEIVSAFIQNPDDPQYDVKEKKLSVDEETENMLEAEKIQQIKNRLVLEQKQKKKSWMVTRLILLICTILFMFTTYGRYQIVKKDAAAVENPEQLLTPLEKRLMFDDPFLQDGKMPPLVWPGLYDILLHYPKENQDLKAPLFVKISHGQIWRLITPCFLHGNILHILFNMMWLWLLGKQVEERVGAVRYILLMLVIGIISNVLQYLMTGFSFVGFSGIICGLAGFIWIRQKSAPWEGYPLQKGTAFFLMIFVLGITGLQFIAFFLEFFHIATFPLYIANTAHVSGAIIGMLLAKVPLFSR